MTAKEAWNSMMAGKKVRWTAWFKDAYIYYDDKSLTIKDNNNNNQSVNFFDDYYSNVQWELYEEDERRNTMNFEEDERRNTMNFEEDERSNNMNFEEDERSNNMNFEEARIELLDGKKVRCVDWSKGKYIYFDDKNLLVRDEAGKIQSYGITRWKKHEWELYEEPKKVIKVFISQPMNGRCKCEITKERNKIKKLVEEKYGEGYQIEYLNEDWNTRPKDWSRIQNLGHSIMNMYDADIVVFAPEWQDAEGCFVEHNVAFYYEKKFYVCVIQNNEYILR